MSTEVKETLENIRYPGQVLRRTQEHRVGVLLNAAEDRSEVVIHVLKQCSEIVLADGAANWYCQLDERNRLSLPAVAFACGDMDSISAESLAQLQMDSVEIIKDTDDSINDFHKCLKALEARSSHMPQQQVVVCGALGGRFDHISQNINTLFAFAGAFKDLVLVDNATLVCLLPAGRTQLSIDSELEGPECGLVPIGRPCRSASTTGLRWELSKSPMEFGGMVSTSNYILGTIVAIDVSDPVIWTTSLKADWLALSGRPSRRLD